MGPSFNPCLICYSTTGELLRQATTSNTNKHCSSSESQQRDNDPSQDDFPPYLFILTKLLGIPNNPQCLETYNLKGDKPESLWIHLCKQCEETVGEAGTVYKQLLVLTRRLRSLQKAIAETLQESKDKEVRNYGSVAFPLEITNKFRNYIFEGSLFSNDAPGGFLVEELVPLESNEKLLLIKEESMEIEEEDNDVDEVFTPVEDDVEGGRDDEEMDNDSNVSNENSSADDQEIISNQEMESSDDDTLDDDAEDDEGSDWEPEPEFCKPKNAKKRKRSCVSDTPAATSTGNKRPVGRPRKVVVKPEKPKKPIVLDPKLDFKPGSDGKYHCPEAGCDKSYSKKFTLKDHVQHKHLGEKLYFCDVKGCGKSFTQRPNFQIHMDRHNGTPKYKCNQCDEKFYARNPLIRHKETVHEDGYKTKPFICEKCGKCFPCRDHLYLHRMSHHRSAAESSKDKERVVCNLCGKLFFATTLARHIQIVHEKKPGKNACHLCDWRFHGRRHLQIHLFTRHQVGPKEYAPTPQRSKKDGFQCPIVGCRKVFYSQEKYDVHMLEMHGEDGKKPGPFRCKLCGKDFYVKSKLKTHDLVHQNSETRPFTCDICGKGFPAPNHLRFHQVHTHKLKLKDGRHCPSRRSNTETE